MSAKLSPAFVFLDGVMNLQSATSAAVSGRVHLEPEDIAARLTEAGETLTALPDTGCRPRGFHVLWSTTLPEPGDVRSNDLTPRRSPPLAAEISRMDEAFGWVELIDPELPRERRIVLLRALRWSWARIGRQERMSGEGARYAHAYALRQIAAALNGRPVQRGRVGRPPKVRAAADRTEH